MDTSSTSGRYLAVDSHQLKFIIDVIKVIALATIILTIILLMVFLYKVVKYRKSLKYMEDESNENDQYINELIDASDAYNTPTASAATYDASGVAAVTKGADMTAGSSLSKQRISKEEREKIQKRIDKALDGLTVQEQKDAVTVLNEMYDALV